MFLHQKLQGNVDTVFYGFQALCLGASLLSAYLLYLYQGQDDALL